MKWTLTGTLAVIASAVLAEEIDPKFRHHKHPQSAGSQDDPTVFEIIANKYHDIKDDVQNHDDNYVPPHAARAAPGGNAFNQFYANYMDAVTDYALGKRDDAGTVGRSFYRVLRHLYGDEDDTQLENDVDDYESAVVDGDEYSPGQDQSDFLNSKRDSDEDPFAIHEYYQQVSNSGDYGEDDQDYDYISGPDQDDFLNHKRSDLDEGEQMVGHTFYQVVKSTYQGDSDIQRRSGNSQSFVGRKFYQVVKDQYQDDSYNGQHEDDANFASHRRNDQVDFLESSESSVGHNFYRAVKGLDQAEFLNARSDEGTGSAIRDFYRAFRGGDDQKKFLNSKRDGDTFAGRTFYRAVVGKDQRDFLNQKRSADGFAGRSFYRAVLGQYQGENLNNKRTNDQEDYLTESEWNYDEESSKQDQSDFLNNKRNDQDDFLTDSHLDEGRSHPYGNTGLNFVKKVKDAYHGQGNFGKRSGDQYQAPSDMPQEEDPQAIEFFENLVKGHKRSQSEAAKNYCQMKLEQGVAAKNLPGFCDDNIVIEALKEQDYATPAGLREDLYEREKHAKRAQEQSYPNTWKDSMRTAWSKIKRYYDLDELDLSEDSQLECRGEQCHKEPEIAQDQSEVPEDPDRRRRRSLTTGEIEDGDSLPDGVIRSTMKKRPMNEETKDFLRKRSFRNTVNATLFNLIDYYVLDAYVGTPPQHVELMVDTGSSDMWVYATGHGSNPDIITFNPGKSKSWQGSNSGFRIRYVTGGASGNWGKDTVNIQGSPLKQQQFAIVTKGTALEGVPGMLGIGMPALESVSWQRYSNVPMSMYSQGFTKTPTYSLYLNSLDAEQGQLLFGGIDHAKYKPPLYVIPRKSNRNFDSKCEISSNSMIGTVVGTFDSGTTLGLLPNRVLKRIQEYWRMKYDSEGRYYYVDSLNAISNKPLTFNFSGAVYKLYPKQLFIAGEQIGPGFNHLVFGFISSEENSRLVIFGDVFLRNFYIVYDLLHPQIGIALASYDSKKEDIQAITSPNFPRAKIAPVS